MGHNRLEFGRGFHVVGWPARSAVIRKLILTAALAAGAVAGVTATASAQPAVPFDRHDHDRHGVRSEVRDCGHWDTYGTYRDRDEARRVVRALERQGRDARGDVERGQW